VNLLVKITEVLPRYVSIYISEVLSYFAYVILGTGLLQMGTRFCKPNHVSDMKFQIGSYCVSLNIHINHAENISYKRYK
jgi:hypothetical protein